MNIQLNRRVFLALVSASLARAQEPITRPVISEDSCPVETIAPVTRDGYRGRGVLRKPPGAGPYPTIIWIHPGLLTFPQSALLNISRGSANPSRFLAAGYVVTLPTYRSRDEDQANTLSSEEFAAQFDSAPAGVVVRHRTSMNYPVAIPDLIGVKNRRYLDRTGLVQHRGIGDLMRYAALNNEMDFLSKFGDFIPRGENHLSLPDPSTQLRYSDEQLYALSEYLYTLKPPRNPNKPSALTRRGQKIFDGSCSGCHTPPFYTNNKLTPARGFTVPEDHKNKYDVMMVDIGTDPGLTLGTRRGTGYYKVPSLQGVWYRGPFEHNGSVSTLEDWFDPRRLSAEYVPTGFKGYGMQTRAVKGHEYGLNLSIDDKRALIAFLRTL